MLKFDEFRAIQAKKKAEEDEKIAKEAELYTQKDPVEKIQHVLDFKQR